MKATLGGQRGLVGRTAGVRPGPQSKPLHHEARAGLGGGPSGPTRPTPRDRGRQRGACQPGKEGQTLSLFPFYSEMMAVSKQRESS